MGIYAKVCAKFTEFVNHFFKNAKILKRLNDGKMMKKDEIIADLNKLFSARSKFYAFFDANLPKVKNTDVFDYSSDENLKDAYKLFHHYDYAIRKLLPSLYEKFDIDMDKDLKKDF